MAGEDQAPMSAAEHQQQARKHIFVVNSSPDFLDFIRQLLQDEQYNVTTTNFVPRTFEQIDALQPDLLLVDLVAGQQAGWALLERLQAEAVTNRIPVVVTATDPRLMAQAEAQQARYGGQHFVAKPFDVDELLEAIQSLIGGAERDAPYNTGDRDS